MEIEKRANRREAVDYLAELWVCKSYDNENLIFNDIGFRGIVKDISFGGALLCNFVNLNLMGLQIKDVLEKESKVKLVMHFEGERKEIEGTLAWLNTDKGQERLGINFNRSN